MATVSTSIQLIDRVSGTIGNIVSAIENVCSAFESVEASMDGGFDASAIESARAALSAAVSEADRLGDEINRNVNNQDRFNNEVREGAAHLNGLTNSVMGLVGAYASLQGVQKIVNLSDEYIQTSARLGMINDGLQTDLELQEKIYASAQRSRASYTATADTIAKLSLNAGDAFGSNDETIRFAENLNKLFVVAGTNQASIASATLQLTQALGSGVLRGEELNAVFEAAPNVIRTVADYLDVPIGKIREMAKDGEITADIVKNALLNATDSINEQFESMPMTWGQVWTGVMNELYMASVPLFETISFLAQNWSVLKPIVISLAAVVGIYTAALLYNNAVTAMSAILKAAHAAKEMMAAGATMKATIAQHGFNAALLASPITMYIILVIALIAAFYAVIAVINKVTGSSLSATGMITGALLTAVAFIWNLFLGLLDFILGIINALVNPWIAWINFFGNLFNDPIGSIIHLFGDFADNILGVVENIAKALDKVFGSNLAGSVQTWRNGLDEMVEEVANKYGNGKYEAIVEGLNLSSESLGLKRWEYGDAYETGYNWGANAQDGIGNAIDEVLNSSEAVNEIANNTEKTADSLSDTEEDLEYLRDIAERDTINRFTTAEITIEQTNHNNIGSSMDIDGVMERWNADFTEILETAAEGVH